MAIINIFKIHFSFIIEVEIILTGLIMILISSLSIYFLVKRAGRLSKRGIRLYKELRGLYTYIRTAEAERIKFFNNPNRELLRFEKLLPYVILFGLEDQWINILQQKFKTIRIDYTPKWLTNTSISSFAQLNQELKKSLNSYKTLLEANLR